MNGTDNFSDSNLIDPDLSANMSATRGSKKNISDNNGATSNIFYQEITDHTPAEELSDYIYKVKVENGRAVETRHSQGCGAVTGYTPEDFQNDPYLWINMVVLEDQCIVRNIFERLLNGEDSFSVVHRIRKPNGSIRWIHSGVMSDRDDNGQLLSYMGFIKDITEQKVIEELNRSERLFRSVWESSRDGMRLTDKDGIMIKVNEAFCRLCGKAKDELEGKSISEIYSPDEGVKILQAYTDNFSNNKIKPFIENQYTLWNGDRKWFAVSTSYFTLNENQPVVLSIFRDITNRKHDEEVLHENEERIKALLNANPDIMFLFDIEGRIVDYFAGSKTLPYTSPEEFIGKNLTEVLPPDIARLTLDKLNSAFQDRQMQVYDYTLNINGLEMTFESRLVQSGKSHALSIVRDITQQKKTEQALIEEEKKYHELYSLLRLMSDTMPDMLWAKDINGGYIFANKAICTNLLNAVDTLEPIGKTDIFFAERERASHPENPEWHTFGELCVDSDKITLNEMKEMQFEEFGNVKGKFMYLDVHKAPLIDKNGELIGVVGSARDITERKKAEEKLMSSLKEKELLLKEIHHRVKNNFQIITSLLALQADMITDEKLLHIFNNSKNRIKSMALIHEIMYKSENLSTIHVPEYITTLVDYFRLSFPAKNNLVNLIVDVDDIEIEFDDLVPIGIILSELITNAYIHAFPDDMGGEIFVSLKQSSNSNLLTVRNNGVNLPADFDYLNPESLGLFLVRTLTKQIDGELSVTNPGLGTIFEINFRK